MPDPTDTKEEAEDPALEALWNRALEAWNDERTHAALLDHALRAFALPELAGRYRALANDADKGPLAKKKVDAIVLAATNLLWSTKMPAPGKVPLPITLTAVAVTIFLLSWLTWAVWGHHG